MLKNNCLCLLLLLSGSAFSWQDISYFTSIPNQPIEVNIGLKSHNRITIKGNFIKEIISDENLYQIILTSSRNHIFIVPKSIEVPIINLSLITESNIVMEFALRVVDEYGKTIIVDVKND